MLLLLPLGTCVAQGRGCERQRKLRLGSVQKRCCPGCYGTLWLGASSAPRVHGRRAGAGDGLSPGGGRLERQRGKLRFQTSKHVVSVINPIKFGG